MAKMTSTRSSDVLAVIMDWAGTSVDFGSLAPVAALSDVFRGRGIEVTPEALRLDMGLKKKDHVRRLLDAEVVRKQWRRRYGRPPGEEDVNKVYGLLKPALIKRLRDDPACSEPVPGVLSFVRGMQCRGVKVGTTTGYTRPMMKVLARRAAQWGFLPDCIVSSSDVPAGRPWPFMCHLNAYRLGFDVGQMSRMIKIGDTVADIEEGGHAGMWTIGVVRSGNSLGLSRRDAARLSEPVLKSKSRAGRARLRNAGADYVIDGVWDAEPVIDAIIQRIREGEKPESRRPAARAA